MKYELAIAEGAHEDITRNAVWWAGHQGNRRSYRAVFTIHKQTVYVLAVHRAAQDVIRPGDLSFYPNEPLDRS